MQILNYYFIIILFDFIFFCQNLTIIQSGQIKQGSVILIFNNFITFTSHLYLVIKLIAHSRTYTKKIALKI